MGGALAVGEAVAGGVVVPGVGEGVGGLVCPGVGGGVAGGLVELFSCGTKKETVSEAPYSAPLASRSPFSVIDHIPSPYPQHRPSDAESKMVKVC